MRRFVVALLATSALSVSAFAADMPVKAPVYRTPIATPYNWTGCYIGAEGGGNWGSSSADSAIGTKVDSHNLSGGLAGGTVGCNYQMDSWVFGVEGDFSWTNKKGSSNLAAPVFNTAFSETIKESWISTLRGRVGYALYNSWLLYATGGVAWARANVDEFNTAGALVGSDAHTMSGGTVGGGVEWMFAPQWSVKAEYLHVWFANSDFLNGITGVTPETRHLSDDIFRVGLNYQFWSGH